MASPRGLDKVLVSSLRLSLIVDKAAPENAARANESSSVLLDSLHPGSSRRPQLLGSLPRHTTGLPDFFCRDYSVALQLYRCVCERKTRLREGLRHHSSAFLRHPWAAWGFALPTAPAPGMLPLARPRHGRGPIPSACA